MTNILVESHSQLPAHAQIKDQIKFACVHEKLTAGNVLPSIRRLARQLSVGDGVVRRAYRELCEVGLLVAEGRNHMVGTPALAGASKADIVRASAEECDRMITWARENRLSAIGLSRFLLRHALAREIISPSYMFVDTCKLAAEMSADSASKAWGIRIKGVSVGDFMNRWSNAAGDLTAVLVNECLYEDVIDVVGELAPRVFSVRVRPDDHLRRRVTRLPRRSTVIFVCSDEDFSRAGRVMLQHYEQLFGGRWRFQARKISDIQDLTRFIRTARSRLFLFSPLAWETLPARVKRMVKVAPAFCEPDPKSLEEVRVAAGVLL